MALENEGLIELYDVTTKAVITKVPIAHIRFLARAGERVLIPTGPATWKSYKVLDVEYFMNYDPAKNTLQTASEGGKITLYVEPATQSQR
jgi:hypothetical protein